MISTLTMPSGWYGAAMAAEVSSRLQAGLRPDITGDLFAGPSTPGELQGAWERFRSLQRARPPLITYGHATYQVKDVEARSDGLLLFGRATTGHRESSRWRVFYQESSLDSEPLPLPPQQIQENLLADYCDRTLHIRPKELTGAKIVREGDIRREGTDGYTQEICLQNGHRILLRWSRNRDRETFQMSPLDLIGMLRKIPLTALSQIDEIRLMSEYHPHTIGQSYVRNYRWHVDLYPFNIADLTDNPLRFDLQDPKIESKLATMVHYNIFHEILGHSLMGNRFLLREVVKVIASGEEAPSAYAETSLLEWFPEGIAERWMRVMLTPQCLREWDKKFRYLSGLIKNLLGVMEGYVEPATENIKVGSQLLRPLKRTAC